LLEAFDDTGDILLDDLDVVGDDLLEDVLEDLLLASSGGLEGVSGTVVTNSMVRGMSQRAAAALFLLGNDFFFISIVLEVLLGLPLCLVLDFDLPGVLVLRLDSVAIRLEADSCVE